MAMAHSLLKLLLQAFGHFRLYKKLNRVTKLKLESIADSKEKPVFLF